jgi:hypothetical protein
MADGDRLKPLRATLVVVGVVFVVALYPLAMFWPAGWIWHAGGHSDYLEMIMGIYAVLGLFLILAARRPLEHLSLIWFTVWSSVAHAAIMAVQSSVNPEQRGHLLGDVPALLIIAAALATVTLRAERARTPT